MNSFPIPDFIVIGAQFGDEVIMLASKALTHAELHEEFRNADAFYYHGYAYDPPQYDMHITAYLKDYVWVRGKNYAEAWQALFETWSPTPPERRELSGRKMLP